MTKKMYEQLRNAVNEKDIEKIYHSTLTQCLSEEGAKVEQIKSIRGTDGIVDGEFYLNGKAHVFRIIVETKNNESFQQPLVRSKALIQVLYYMKDFEDNGIKIPNIILVGDRDECFLVHSNYVQKYLSINSDWSSAPSQAYRNNPTLLKMLTEDSELQSQCFVHTIDENFSFYGVIDQIKALTQNIKYEVRLTPKNIRKVFDYFTLHVLQRKSSGEAIYTPRQQVEFFMELVLEPDDVFIHPKKKNTAKFKGVDVKVNAENFLAFTEYYTFNYNAEEKKQFTEICDQLIEESDRRFRGDFYTPSIWVDEAHKLLNETLGYDWKEQYMVWDCAWGTGNLTRDYRFFELYASTLHDHDLEIGRKYNQEAEAKFQYDFLNDDVEHFDMLLQQVKMGYQLTEKDFYGTKLWEKAPSLIRGLLQGKKLLFFINPPYGTAGSMRKGTKDGVADTLMGSKMKEEKIGASSQQLYAQFVYRIIKLKRLFNSNLTLALFAPTLYMTGKHFEGLRDEIEQEFIFADGYMIQASEFADVSSNWSISFCLFKPLEEEKTTLNCKVSIKALNETGIESKGDKILYSVEDKDKLSTWVRDKSIINTQTSFTMSSALRVSDGVCYIPDELLAFGLYDANKVESNNQSVTILPRKMKANIAAIPITPSNFYKPLVVFTARRLITGKYATWENSKDEYMIPNINHPLYKQWESDAIVYSLFNTASNQSSLRDIEYNGKQWDIYNHFFFLSRQDMKDLALGSDPNDVVYEDLQNHAEDERFVYKKLQEVTLSPDAQAVLDKARQLVKDSFKFRNLFNQEHPEYHINTWDAGWYQIKGLLKEYMPDELKEFNELFKQFENRMRPLVVELGFLYDYPGYEEDKNNL